MKHVIKPAAILFTIAALVTALLSMAHLLTLKPIEEKLRRTQENAMKEVLAQATDFKEISAEVSGNIVRIFEGSDGGEVVGYVVELSPSGYSGNIGMMVGISSVDNVLSGMRVLKHSETPGLGALAVKKEFYSKYNGKELAPLKVVKTSPSGNEIDAITSATITTRAITNAVNEAIDWYNGGAGK